MGVDFIDEDVEIKNQKYCVLSYTLPKPQENSKGKQRVGFDTPMVKIRGAYSTVEECESRIEKLKLVDKYFHMYIASVGTWGPLLTEDQHKEAGTNAVYMNKEMNDFMQSYKEGQDRKTDIFEERKNRLAEAARRDGTPEGQAALASKRENPISVKNRIEGSLKAVKELEEELETARKVYSDALALYETYSQEEIESADLEAKTNALKITEVDE